MKYMRTYVAYLLLVGAALAWALVVYFGWSVQGSAAAKEAEIELERQAFTQRNSSVRTHAIAIETARERAELEALLSKNVVAIASTLRAVGRSTGVSVSLGSAVPESTPAASTPSGSLQAVGFALEADGSFGALMRTAELIETLPLASRVERFDMQRIPGGTAARWHMSVYITVLTSADISS